MLGAHLPLAVATS